MNFLIYWEEIRKAEQLKSGVIFSSYEDFPIIDTLKWNKHVKSFHKTLNSNKHVSMLILGYMMYKNPLFFH